MARILGPLVKVVDSLDEMGREPRARHLISEAGGPTAIKLQILSDFFKNGFDGSGADNFFDAGSCIDGRLTSAWNWCSLLDEKPFYSFFKLGGFVGFDGKFAG